MNIYNILKNANVCKDMKIFDKVLKHLRRKALPDKS